MKVFTVVNTSTGEQWRIVNKTPIAAAMLVSVSCVGNRATKDALVHFGQFSVSVGDIVALYQEMKCG